MDRFVRERESYVFGHYWLDATRRVLSRDGAVVALTPTVFDALLCLVENPARVMSKEELMTAVWPGRFLEEANLTQTISMLRKALNAAGDDGHMIATAPGRGYRFTADVRQVTGPASPETRPISTESLLAVLAFENLSGDPDMVYFSDGLSEEILQTVARRADIKVIGRASSFQFRGAAKAAANVAAELKATHVLDGSVRRAGERVRISAELIECAGQTSLWIERFERDLGDVFALQDDIAGAVAAALNARFSPSPLPEFVNPQAYELYLRALEPNGYNASMRAGKSRLLEQATRLAPNFARAWLRLASLLAMRLRFDALDQPYDVTSGKITKAAAAALEIDPTLGEAYQALSDLKPFAAFAGREALHNRALSVDARDTSVLFKASSFAADVGRVREGLVYAKKSQDGNPNNPMTLIWYAWMLDAAGRYQDSHLVWDRCFALWPDSVFVVVHYIYVSALNADWTRYDTAVSATRERNLFTPDIEHVVLFGSQLREPNIAIIDELVNQTREELRNTGTISFDRLANLCSLGRADAAFEIASQTTFEFMTDPQQRWPAEITTSLLFSAAHNRKMMEDIRFVSLCLKLGLCSYWVETQRWPDCADLVDYDFRAEARRLTRAGA